MSKIEAIYARAFPKGGVRSDLFWASVEDSANKFLEATNKRPLTQMEISHAEKVAVSEFAVHCSQEARRGHSS